MEGGEGEQEDGVGVGGCEGGDGGGSEGGGEGDGGDEENRWGGGER